MKKGRPRKTVENERGRRANRLIRESSPYLLQHAFNPVDWRPWGEQAFAEASRLDRPVFLSIGYSTCHWCHVMERESFEDKEIAALINRYFIPVKVDREERPDLDAAFMAATSRLTGQGGWPMTLFLTPGGEPFYAGTYFPPRSIGGRLGLTDLLQAVHAAWTTRRQALLSRAAEVVDGMSGDAMAAVRAPLPGDDAVRRCIRGFAAVFDTRNGGFGPSPKFARPAALDFLLAASVETDDPLALAMAETTAVRMAKGGVFDQIGGGFHRYSVDAGWALPHFEKMLYDQGQLACFYLDLYAATGNELYRETARRTLSYVIERLRAPEGGFMSAEDADSVAPGSAGVPAEGAYYCWTMSELAELLEPADLRLAANYFDFRPDGNLPAEACGELAGANLPRQGASIEAAAAESGVTPAEARRGLARICKVLRAARDTRPPPFLDNKILLASSSGFGKRSMRIA